MTKAMMKILERCFEDEVKGAMRGHQMPTQFNKPSAKPSKALQKCLDEELVMLTEIRLGGPMPMKVAGYVLTIKGNMAYCMNCGDE